MERQLIADLRKTINQLTNSPDSSDISNTNREDFAGIWSNFSSELRRVILDEDPRRFLYWNIIRRTMFVNSPFCYFELRHLQRKADWSSRWRPVLREDSFGQPAPFLFYPFSSGNLIHHAYHLALFEEKTAINISDLPCIVEFGAGYGSLCRLIHKLGYLGTYVCFDLPEFSALQRFFLRGIGLPVDGVGSAARIILLHQVSDLTTSLRNVPDKSLFIATWSLSETPLEYRKEIMELIDSFNYYLIAYADTFSGINNIVFFESWRRSFGGKITWFDWPIKHLPGNRYLIGVKSSVHKGY